jgi:hypothetical protein
MKYLFLIIALFFLAVVSYGQTGVTTWNTSEQNGTYVVKMVLSSQQAGDSTTAVTSNPYSIPDYNAYIYSNPPTFHIKTTGTYGAPTCRIRILGYFNNGGYAFDTLRIAGTQSQTDTVGVLSQNGFVAPAYQIEVTNTGKAITTGLIEIVYTKPRHFILK